ncbi:uncharacterized protein VP01_1466g2 [Puccinia sorghi]|uniref:Glucose-repressible protein n=1 Tax=Puccinia sorghi TaxID=27349 RepID=A0A0L6VJP6_9BASI|nr:uncharacterized protein VP01_1466g2 [Puccinia sorghi]
MQTAKDAVNYVTDKASELTNAASKEANKNVAKDSDASLSTRATAAKDAIGDKASELKDGASAEVNKMGSCEHEGCDDSKYLSLNLPLRMVNYEKLSETFLN